MKKLLIAVAIVLSSVAVANAGGVKCEIVQVFPGIFLPQCESYSRYEHRSHYRGDSDRMRYERGHRHNRYERNHRHAWDHSDRRRHHRRSKEIRYSRPHHHDNYRW